MSVLRAFIGQLRVYTPECHFTLCAARIFKGWYGHGNQRGRCNRTPSPICHASYVNDTIFANLFELSEDQIWVREFPRLYTKWMQIAHTAYHDNETAANMFFYFALSTSNTEAEYAHWFVSTGPNTYHDDVAKIAALKQHFAATPHGNVTHDEMIFVQRLYEKAAYLTFYLDKTEDLCVHVKNMMKKSTESLSRSISICHIYDTRIKILTYFQIL